MTGIERDIDRKSRGPEESPLGPPHVKQPAPTAFGLTADLLKLLTDSAQSNDDLVFLLQGFVGTAIDMAGAQEAVLLLPQDGAAAEAVMEIATVVTAVARRAPKTGNCPLPQDVDIPRKKGMACYARWGPSASPAFPTAIPFAIFPLSRAVFTVQGKQFALPEDWISSTGNTTAVHDKTGVTSLSQEADNQPTFPSPAVQRLQDAMQSFAVVPLKGDTHTIGILCFLSPQKAMRWHKSAQQAAEMAAAACSLALTRRKEKTSIAEARHFATHITKDMADDYDRHLTDMAHEMRTPLSTIKGMNDLLLQTDLTNEQRAFARITKKAADALFETAISMLDAAQIRSGKLQLARVPFNLKELLASTLDLFPAHLIKKDIDLRGSIDPGLPANMVGDPARIRQILINLVGNAIKSTEKGKITIRVFCPETERGTSGEDTRQTASDQHAAHFSPYTPSARPSAPQKNLTPLLQEKPLFSHKTPEASRSKKNSCHHTTRKDSFFQDSVPAKDNRILCFSVTDTGIGIPSEVIAQLFDRFVSGPPSFSLGTESPISTGLGLSISRQLATLMGGEIGAQSEPGKGSTFWFTVQLRETPANPQSQK